MSLNFYVAADGLPAGPRFQQLDRSEQQTILYRLLERLVEQLENQGRAPDAFERQHLGQAIVCMKRGLLEPVASTAMRACTPVADRVPILGGDAFEVPADFTLRQLLERAEG